MGGGGGAVAGAELAGAAPFFEARVGRGLSAASSAALPVVGGGSVSATTVGVAVALAAAPGDDSAASRRGSVAMTVGSGRALSTVLEAVLEATAPVDAPASWGLSWPPRRMRNPPSATAAIAAPITIATPGRPFLPGGVVVFVSADASVVGGGAIATVA